MLTVPFLTDLDPQAAIKGSRDPLGIQPIWTRMGRHVVGNLTTVSTSVRDFTTTILGYYFAERVSNEDHGGTDLAVFLCCEQLAAYARGGINKDSVFRGTERAKKNFNENARLRLGTASAALILSDQKTYGLWGLYSVPSRSSGLLTGDPARVTPSVRKFIEDEYLPEGAIGDDANLVTRYALAVDKDTFFDRFAGIFISFGNLERHIRESLNAGNSRPAEYRLFGQKYDSLGRLLDRVRDDSEKNRDEIVEHYVMALCARQIARNSRTFATMTSWPSSCSCALIQIECVPASIATRAGATSVNHFSIAFGVLLKRPRPTTSPSWLRVQ